MFTKLLLCIIASSIYMQATETQTTNLSYVAAPKKTCSPRAQTHATYISSSTLLSVIIGMSGYFAHQFCPAGDMTYCAVNATVSALCGLGLCSTIYCYRKKITQLKLQEIQQDAHNLLVNSYPPYSTQHIPSIYD